MGNQQVGNQQVGKQQAELAELVREILHEARKQGTDAAEVSVSADAGLAVNVRKGEIENLEFNQDRGFGVTVYVGQSKGSASTTDSSATAIADTVRAARDIAAYTEDDPCNGLADPDLMPDVLPELDLYHPWDVSPEAATDLAIACEAAGLDLGDPRLTRSDGAQVSTQRSIRAYGNSHDFVGVYSGTRHGISTVYIAQDEQGMQRDYWYTSGRDAAELQSAGDVGVEAARRTLARLSPRSAPTGSYPVLFVPQLASGLFGSLLSAASGGAQYRKSTFLLDAVGEQVVPTWLSLVERPHLKKAIGSASFDGDGVATREQAFVRDGVLERYLLSTYSARKLGLKTTGNAGGIHNLDVESARPGLSEAQLRKEMGTGLLVCELMGQGVNAVTGDYSRGAAGFWIEDGEIAFPVAELTIAGNLKDMYTTIVALGDDVDYRGNIRAPSVLMEEMMVAGSG
ncbi:MAG: metalloprotease PmbA [Pseudomonadota bacterium]